MPAIEIIDKLVNGRITNREPTMGGSELGDYKDIKWRRFGNIQAGFYRGTFISLQEDGTCKIYNHQPDAHPLAFRVERHPSGLGYFHYFKNVEEACYSIMVYTAMKGG